MMMENGKNGKTFPVNPNRRASMHSSFSVSRLRKSTQTYQELK